MYIAGCVWVLMLLVSSLAICSHKWKDRKEAIIIAVIVYITSSIFLLVFGIYGLDYK